MNLKEHRIYIHFSKPWRLIGFTKDEISLFLFGFFMFGLVKPRLMGFILFVCCLVGIWGVKRFKKRTEGFSVMSALHWYLGVRPKGSPFWPESHKKWWLS